MTGKRRYYAAHSSMGVGYTYDSPCWMVHVFPSAEARDQFVHDNAGSAEPVSLRTARRIAPELRMKETGEAWRVIVHE